MTGFPPDPVILGTPVITAIGGITGGSGIQRNKGNRLDIPVTPQRGPVGCSVVKGAIPSRCHSRACSGIQRNKGKHLDIPATHQRGPVGCGVVKGAIPSRCHSRACSGIQRNKVNHLGHLHINNNKMIRRSPSFLYVARRESRGTKARETAGNNNG